MGRGVRYERKKEINNNNNYSQGHYGVFLTTNYSEGGKTIFINNIIQLKVYSIYRRQIYELFQCNA